MPFQSQAQRAYMYAKHPEIAQRWSAEYPHQTNLPQHVGDPKQQIVHALVQRKMRG